MLEEINSQEYQQDPDQQTPIKNEEEDIIYNFFDDLDQDIVLNKLETSDENSWYTSWYMITLYAVLGVLLIILLVYLIKKNATI